MKHIKLNDRGNEVSKIQNIFTSHKFTCILKLQVSSIGMFG